MTTAQREPNMGIRATRELARLAAIFTAGEAEIAQTYFVAATRSQATDILFLTSQAGREFSSAMHLLQSVLDRQKTALASVDRQWLSETLLKVQQEVNHGNLCADILEWLTGRPVDMVELFRYDLFNGDPTAPNNQEQATLSRLFQEQERRPEPWAQLVNHNSGYGLLEGGGCGMFYAASRLSGSEVNARIARAFQIVLEDERGHGPPNLLAVEKFVTTEAQLAEVKAMLRARGRQRLRFRNEQFSYPLPEERLAEIVDGKVDLGMVQAIWEPALFQYVEEPEQGA